RPCRHMIIPIGENSVPGGHCRRCLDTIAASSTPMPRIVARIAGLMLALAPAIAAAMFVVSFPWARPAGKGGATEVFMEMTSIEGATLVGARSDVAVNAM